MGGGGGGGVYYQAVTGEARTTPFRVTTAQTSLRRRERGTPAAENCPTVSSPLPPNPLEIYCHALSRRPPCRRVEVSLYEKGPVTAGSTGGGDPSWGEQACRLGPHGCAAKSANKVEGVEPHPVPQLHASFQEEEVFMPSLLVPLLSLLVS